MPRPSRAMPAFSSRGGIASCRSRRSTNSCFPRTWNWSRFSRNNLPRTGRREARSSRPVAGLERDPCRNNLQRCGLSLWKWLRGSACAVPVRHRSRSVEKEHNAMRMQEIDIHDYARQLFEARGDKAVVEAAQKARSLEEQGQREEAETWRQVEAALKLMRGPHAS